MAAAVSATAPTNTGVLHHQVLGQGQERQLSHDRRPGDDREARHHRHLGEDLPPHRGAGRASRPTQAELAQPDDHALPDDAGQAEGHHQQQEAREHRQHGERHHVVAQLALTQVLHGGHAERPVRGFALQPPDEHGLQRGRRPRPDANQQPFRHAGVRDVEPDAIEQHGLRHRVGAVLPEVLDHADDTLRLVLRIRLGVGLFGDDLADRVGVAENRPRHLDVDQHGLGGGRVVLPREAAAGHDGHRQQRHEVVGHAVVEVIELAAVGQRQPAAPARVDVRPGERAGRDLDLRQLADRRQQPGEHLALARLRRGGGLRAVLAGQRARPADVDRPDALGVETERRARVDGEGEPEQGDHEDDEEGAEDLDRQQQVLALPVPEQAYQVAGHRDGPPLRASTGWSRAIRHAG